MSKAVARKRSDYPGGVNGMTPTTTWTRVRRRLGFEPNPLRRRSDMVEAWLLPAAIAVFLVLGPLLVGAAGSWARAANAAAAQAERSWHRVPAVVLEAVPGPMMSDNGANSWMVWAPARWIAGGREHAGRIPAPSGTRAGATVPVWLDRAGRVQAPPLAAGQVRYRAALAAVVGLTFLAAILACLVLAGRWLLDCRRLAGWGTAWLAVGPQWSRRG
jgi:hypothetical protein